MTTQPSAVKAQVDRKYALVPTSTVARQKIGCQDWAYIDDDPARDPDANLRRYDLFEEKKWRANHFMLGANIHDNPQRRSSRHRAIDRRCRSQRANYIGQQSRNQHTDCGTTRATPFPLFIGNKEYAFLISLLQCPWHFTHPPTSLLACLRPISSPPLLPWFRSRRLSTTFYSAHRSTFLLSNSLTSLNTIRPLPLSHVSLPS